jgi:hypothetical protein
MFGSETVRRVHGSLKVNLQRTHARTHTHTFSNANANSYVCKLAQVHITFAHLNGSTQALLLVFLLTAEHWLLVGCKRPSQTNRP